MKYLELFESFIYVDGCLMLDLSKYLDWDIVLSEIDEEDVYNNEDGISNKNIPYGLQRKPHVTLLYPIKDVKYSSIEKLIDDNLPSSWQDGIPIKLRSIECFKSTNYDILHFKVQINDTLSKFRKVLKDNISNDCKHKSYKPHITIAYIKKGTGDKYLRKSVDINIGKVDSITYSYKDKNDVYKIMKNIK